MLPRAGFCQPLIQHISTPGRFCKQAQWAPARVDDHAKGTSDHLYRATSTEPPHTHIEAVERSKVQRSCLSGGQR